MDFCNLGQSQEIEEENSKQPKNPGITAWCLSFTFLLPPPTACYSYFSRSSGSCFYIQSIFFSSNQWEREAIMGFLQVDQDEKFSLNLRRGHGFFGGIVQLHSVKWVLLCSVSDT